MVGHAVDVAAKCEATGEDTMLNCEPKACPIGGLSLGCYQRRSMSGVIETFRTAEQYAPARLGPTFTACAPAVWDEVIGIAGVCR